MSDGFSAVALADRLGLHRPTDEQAAVIEAPLAPALVVAGAGSGKTETMALRVVWLLANGLVEAHEVLGLTFTRKAASSLAERIRTRVGLLHRAGLAPAYDPFEPPVVATYNAFANGVYRDWAGLIGRDGTGAVLGDASAWQMARRVVLESEDEALGDLDVGVDRITELVLQLAAGLGEHAADPDAVAAMVDRYAARLAAVPTGRPAYQSELDAASKPAATLPLLLPLVAAYQDRKRAAGTVQYADQVSLALAILERAPDVATDLQRRHRVVLLDEYQDTSVVQTRLLARLFAGTPVMAVGDPHQSIYGWRGASAGNLAAFPAEFGDAARTTVFPLSTSWRNGTRILDAANTLAAPLAAESSVEVLRLRPSAVASEAPVEAAVLETLAEEADHVAEWLAARLAEGGGPAGTEPPSAALLLRARRTLPEFLAAMRAHGVPYHVLGVGGLLQEPEVADLVSALRVVHDAQAGAELVRLLAGAAWRIGPADLLALQRLARWLERRDEAQQPLEADVATAFERSLAEGESASIVDALDFVGRVGEHGLYREFSDEGLVRLRHAGRLFADLRLRSGADLPDFVHIVTEALSLDVEVLANEARTGLGGLQAFDEALTGYLAVAEGATLGGFLGWLALAEHREDLRPRSEEPEPGTVQVLTVHGAKGLEWDAVAVPRLVDDELPAKPRSTSGWLAAGELPWEFRGDADRLPTFPWQELTDRLSVKQEVQAYKAAVGERLLGEERRLAYVAVTRARHRLLLTGSFWATQTTPRAPSRFLHELATAGVVPEPPEAPASAVKPEGAPGELFVWPRDPLGGRRAAVEAAARAVLDADLADADGWSTTVDELLVERAERSAGASGVHVPDRVPASRFRDYIDDPVAVAEALRRPMPERPRRATRLGTRFHAWVEARSGRTAGVQLDAALDAAFDLDVLEFDGDPQGDDDATFERLQTRFAASEWGPLEPVEVETEIQLPFADRIVVCKIDAVYSRNGRTEIVDWKTGRPPSGPAATRLAEFQLALYRLAYAERERVDPGTIDAALYYVAHDRVVRPERLYSAAELLAAWSSAFAGTVLT